MFDARIRPLIDPPLNRLGHVIAARGVTADQVTVAGCALGLLGAMTIALDYRITGTALFLLGRLLDGLDGAVARATRKTDRGGYLDIVCDFAVYAAVPLAFAVSDPVQNALPAACLLAAFILNGIAFLAFAVFAAKRGLSTSAQGEKSLYYAAGLAEGAETIAVFAAMGFWPGCFPLLAFGFAGLCLVSSAARIAIALKRLD